jgi:hypothetical protein
MGDGMVRPLVAVLERLPPLIVTDPVLLALPKILLAPTPSVPV